MSKTLTDKGLTFLTAFPRISLQTRADAVPHAHAAVFTGWAADSCRQERIKQRHIGQNWGVLCFCVGFSGHDKLSFTVLTLGSVETVRTLAGIWADAHPSVQTHGGAESCSTQRRCQVSAALNSPGDLLIVLDSPVSQDGPVHPGRHAHSSGDAHWPPLLQ